MAYMRRAVAVALLTLFLRYSLPAQSTQTGFPSFSSQSKSVNLSNLNYGLAAQVLGKQGRGIPINYALHYNSTIYVVATDPGGSGQTFFVIPGPFDPFGLGGESTFGWNTNGLGMPNIPPFDLGFVTANQSSTCSTGATQNSDFVFIDRQGTVHPLPSSVVTSSDGSCGPTQASAFAADQSGYLLAVNGSGGTARDAAGNTFAPGSAIVTDRNGNFISGISGDLTNTPNILTDTLGVNTLSFSWALDSSGNHPVSNTYTYLGPGAVNATVVVNYKIYPRVASGFGCPTTGDYFVDHAGAGANRSPGVALVDNIVLADGSKYSFVYEPTPSSSPVWASGAVTGRLQSVTLPTGGKITYGYPGANGGINCNDGTTMHLTVATADGTTSYDRAITGNNASETTTITDPQGNQTVLSFVPLTNSQITNPPSGNAPPSWIEAQRQIYQGSSANGTLLQTAITCYNGNKSNCSSTVTMPITETSRFTLLPNGKENETDTFLNSTSGQITEVDEYDFGSNSPGSLLRKTLIVQASLGNNILNMPAKVTVCAPGGTDSDCGGSGTKVARTTFGYDETTPTATSGVTQHASVSGPRGNVTSIHKWLNTTGTTLDTTNTFDDTGNILTTTDPGGHKTSFSYASGCNGAFVTKTTLPDTSVGQITVHHKTSAAYDCSTGLLSSATDQNGNQTTFSYDSMFRPTEVDYPDGGKTTTSYPSLTQATVQNKIDGSRSTYSTTLLDGYGRLSRTAAKNGESTPYDQQDFCYDKNGRLSFKSYPYQGQGFSTSQVCSGSGDSFNYDALGRPTKVTHSDGSASTTTYTGLAVQVTDEGNGSSSVSRVLQKDGLGRLVSVCEVYNAAALLGSGGTPTTCGLDISATGFLTSYGYDLLSNLTSVTQGSLAGRTYVYDSLSRMTSETTPEAGTVTYGYNADSLLTTRTRPSPNQTSSSVTTATNYAYDALHRMTGRSYANDPSNTPAATFNYDESSVWNTTLGNTIGRLSSELVSGSSPAEQVFSYDSMGRPMLNAQCTPNTCSASPFTPYSLGYQYDLLGDVTSAGNGVGVTFNYAYNIASQLTQMSSSMMDANHPDVLLSGAHYSPTVITDVLGNGVAETANFSARGLLQSQQALFPGGQASTATVAISGSLQASPSGGGNPPPAATNTPLTSFVAPDGSSHAFYLDTHQHIWHLFWNSTAGWQNQDLTVITSNTPAAANSSLSAVFDSSGNTHVFYLDSSQHVHELFCCFWQDHDLTAITGNTLAGGGAALTSYALSSGNPVHLHYVGANQHVYHLYISANSGAWANEDLTAATGASAAAGSAMTSVPNTSNGSVRLYFLDGNQHLNETYCGPGQCWTNTDMTAYLGAMPASGSALTSYGMTTGNPVHVHYLGTNQHVFHMYLSTSGWVNQDLSAITGAGAAAGSALTSVPSNSNGSVRLYFLDGNQHLNETYCGPGQCWTNTDMTAAIGATPVSGSKLTSFSPPSDNSVHVHYEGANQHIWQMYLNSGGWTSQDAFLMATVTLPDSGTVSLTLGSFIASACFGPSSNPACSGQNNAMAGTVAAALAQALNVASSPVTASASGATINMTWKELGPFTVPVGPLSTAHDQPTLFSNPSFTSPTTNFGGGASSTTAAYSYTLGSAPDGQIISANDSVNGNWTFGYDPFNRLASSNKNTGQQTFTYDYDRYDNRWHQNAPQGGPAPQYTVDTNNHLQPGTGVTYDALGQVLTDGLGNSFVWDAEGRLSQVKQGGTVIASYVYDAEGRRVHGPNGEYLYDLDGTVITQIGLNGVWNYGEIYAAGRHLATYSGGTTNFFHPDWLGTKRVMTGVNGAVSQTCTGFAFGDGVSCTGSNLTFNGFTDYIHDPESNLEHTLFRKYSGTQGRWLTPDPAGTKSADPANPQSWNRYAYVINSPTNATDPNGLCEDPFCGGLPNPFGDPFGSIFPFGYQPPFGGVLSWLPPLSILPGEIGGVPAGLNLPGPIEALLADLPWNNPCARNPWVPDRCGLTNGFTSDAVRAVPWVLGGIGEGLCLVFEPCGLVEAVALGVVAVLTIPATGDNTTHMSKGKENIRPSWAEKYGPPRAGESGKDYADRLCKAEFGPGGCPDGTGPGSDHSKLKKWADRRGK